MLAIVDKYLADPRLKTYDDAHLSLEMFCGSFNSYYKAFGDETLRQKYEAVAIQLDLPMKKITETTNRLYCEEDLYWLDEKGEVVFATPRPPYVPDADPDSCAATNAAAQEHICVSKPSIPRSNISIVIAATNSETV